MTQEDRKGMVLKEILEAANNERKLSDEAFKNYDYFAGIQHGVAYYALANRSSKFTLPPDVTPAGAPAGAREVSFEDTYAVAKAA